MTVEETIAFATIAHLYLANVVFWAYPDCLP
jgi:hypothetical protein